MAATAAAVIEYLLSTLSSRGKGEKKRRSGLHLLTAAAARVQREGEKETKPLCTQRAKAEWEVLKLHHAQNYYVTMRQLCDYSLLRAAMAVDVKQTKSIITLNETPCRKSPSFFRSEASYEAWSLLNETDPGKSWFISQLQIYWCLINPPTFLYEWAMVA